MVGKRPVYGWPLRLTRVGCEGVDIWKKKRFRLRAAAKQIWLAAISRGMKRKPSGRGEERRGEERRRDEKERNAAARKQSLG